MNPGTNVGPDLYADADLVVAFESAYSDFRQGSATAPSLILPP